MPKKKYQLEYVFENVSTDRLWHRISTEEGLNDWIDGKVKFKGEEVSFDWGNSQYSKAHIEILTAGLDIRYHWEDEGDYFALTLEHSDLTNDTNLIITDFADPDEYDEDLEIWRMQIDKLRLKLGLGAKLH